MEMWTKSWKHGHFARCVCYKGMLCVSPGITLFFKHSSIITVQVLSVLSGKSWKNHLDLPCYNPTYKIFLLMEFPGLTCLDQKILSFYLLKPDFSCVRIFPQKWGYCIFRPHCFLHRFIYLSLLLLLTKTKNSLDSEEYLSQWICRGE